MKSKGERICPVNPQANFQEGDAKQSEWRVGESNEPCVYDKS
jgi:hypothetical protein